MQPLRKLSLKDAALSAILHGNEEVWPAVKGEKAVRSRDIFTYVLALYEGDDQHKDRIGQILRAAQKLQVKGSDGDWNFKWYSADRGIKDHNAVEFCMRGAILLWLRHRHKMLPQDLMLLEQMMRRSAQTCRRRAVPEKYTNIALMNAMNVILLGEALDLPETAQAGYKRLDRFLLYTWEWGIHEFAPVDVVKEPVFLNVDQGLVVDPVKKDTTPKGQSFVRLPRNFEKRINDVGHITWHLRAPDADRFFLWGCVQTPAKFEPSFFVRVFEKTHEEPVYQAAWFTGSVCSYAWCSVRRNTGEDPPPLDLSGGDFYVQVFVRSFNAHLAALCVSKDPNFKPDYNHTKEQVL